MQREERVTVQGPVKEQQPDGMSHRGHGFITRVNVFPDALACASVSQGEDKVRGHHYKHHLG